jgi:hypothetical protein
VQEACRTSLCHEAVCYGDHRVDADEPSDDRGAGKEHIGGFWVLEATDMNEALEWGRKAVVACRAPIEVRQFHSL